MLNYLFYGFYSINSAMKKGNSDGYAYMVMSGLMGFNLVAISTWLEIFMNLQFHLSSYFLAFFFFFLVLNYFLFLRNDRYKQITESEKYQKRRRLCIFLAVLYFIFTFAFLILGGYLFRALVLGIE